MQILDFSSWLAISRLIRGLQSNLRQGPLFPMNDGIRE